MSFKNTGLRWDRSGLSNYLSTLTPPARFTSITLHHTGVPSLAQRPDGFIEAHIQNLKYFYQTAKKWSAGPHFFIDPNWIWGLTPPTVKGVHAVSFNRNSLGIEVLGDYNVESPLEGRGLECWTLAAQATKELATWLKIDPFPETIHFHRDDPTTKKTCPGTRVDKGWFLELVGAQ